MGSDLPKKDKTLKKLFADPNVRNWVTRIGALALTIIVTILIVLNYDHIKDFEAFGYPGIFLVALTGSATVFLPAPHLAFTFAMGGVLNPWLVGLAAGLGDTLGETSGYLAGFALEDAADNLRLYHRFESWMKRYGEVTLFLLALIPNPFFDMASIAGGLAGIPLKRFLLVTWAGKTIKAIATAWAGYYGITWIQGLLKE
jgi:uncharacterized membrane protein YdjX (TVP38/TMEM64 family)